MRYSPAYTYPAQIRTSRLPDRSGTIQEDQHYLDPVRSCADLLADRLGAFCFPVDEYGAGHALDAVLVQVKLALRAWTEGPGSRRLSHEPFDALSEDAGRTVASTRDDSPISAEISGPRNQRFRPRQALSELDVGVFRAFGS